MLTEFGSQKSHSQGLGDPSANQKGQRSTDGSKPCRGLEGIGEERLERRRESQFSKREVGDSSRNCLQLDDAVSSFSPRMWTVWPFMPSPN